MTTKWYVSEYLAIEDMAVPFQEGDTLFDTKEEAEKYADELSIKAEMCMCAWPHTILILKPKKDL